MRFAILALLLCSCAVDAPYSVRIAPSAAPHRADIIEAVEKLNLLVPGAPWHAYDVGSEEREDGEVVVRGVDDLGEQTDDSSTAGTSKRFVRGGLILLAPNCDAQTVGHELMHQAGEEEHHEDPANLMHWIGGPERQWKLTQEQIERVM